MPMLLTLARVTTRRREVWRHCETCDELAPMAPYEINCDACATGIAPTCPVELAGGDSDD